MRPLLGHLAAIDDQDPLVLAQRLVHQPPVRPQHPPIVPGPFAHEVLQRPHLPVCRFPGSQQPQRHRLAVLAGHIRHQQPPHIDFGPPPLRRIRKAGAKEACHPASSSTIPSIWAGVTVSTLGCVVTTSTAAVSVGALLRLPCYVLPFPSAYPIPVLPSRCTTSAGRKDAGERCCHLRCNRAPNPVSRGSMSVYTRDSEKRIWDR